MQLIAGSQDSVITGLAINQFGDAGILINGVDGTPTGAITIRGNYIGTDVSGTLDRGNTGQGIELLDSSGHLIGGTTAADQNVISGNSGSGVLITGATSTGNLVQGNLIGTDATGMLDLGNAQRGVSIASSGNIIGGTTALERNVISGNDIQGIMINGAAATFNTVIGNYIGTNTLGSGAVANSVPESSSEIRPTTIRSAERPLVSGT